MRDLIVSACLNADTLGEGFFNAVIIGTDEEGNMITASANPKVLKDFICRGSNIADYSIMRTYRETLSISQPIHRLVSVRNLVAL